MLLVFMYLIILHILLSGGVLIIGCLFGMISIWQKRTKQQGTNSQLDRSDGPQDTESFSTLIKHDTNIVTELLVINK